MWEGLVAQRWETCCDGQIVGVGSPVFAKTAGILMCSENVGSQIFGALNRPDVVILWAFEMCSDLSPQIWGKVWVPQFGRQP